MNSKIFGRTRLVVSLLAAGLVLSACGDDGNGGSSDDVVRIGVAAPLSGPVSSPAFMKSVEMARDQINDAGGIDGKKVELVVKDSGTTAADALTAGRALVQEDVVATVGYGQTIANLAVNDLFKREKMVNLIGAVGVANGFDKTSNPYTFSVNISDDATAENQVTYAVDTLKARKFALLIDAGEFGKGYEALVKPLIEKAGGEVVETQKIATDATDVSVQVGKVLNSEPDVLLVALLAPGPVTLTYNELTKQGGQDLPVVASAAVAATIGLAVPWDVAQGTFVTYMTKDIYDPEKRAGHVAEWFDAVSSDKARPADFHAQSHDQLIILASAIAETGSTDPDELVKYLRGLDGFSEWSGIKTLDGPYSCDASTQFCLQSQYLGQVSGEAFVETAKFGDAR